MTGARTMGRIGIVLTLALLYAMSFAATSRAAFGISGFDGETTSDEAATPFTQAGGHPFIASTTVEFNETTDSEGLPVPDESVRRIQLDLPPGFVANPLATPTRCTESELTGGPPLLIGVCPDSSQVGIATLNLGAFGIFPVPVYNMVPTADEPAQLGIRFLTTDVHIETSIRSGSDYAVTAELNDVSNALPLIGSTVTLWGVPAAPSHDAQRGECSIGAGSLCPTDAPLKPFVTMPTACTPPETGLETSLYAESWLGSKDSASFISHLPPGLPNPGPSMGPTGCGNVPFNPDISLQPTTQAADSPTGLNVDLTIPQAGLETPDGVASAHLKDVVVTLPEGVSVNPASAAGLGACTSTQIGLNNSSDARCPDSSKIGSVQIETPLLKDPVTGSVYLAAQQDNPFSSLLAIYIVAKGPGFVVKLPGHVEADPATGRLTTVFDKNPQLPFSRLHVDFFGGPRAALRTPPTCGTFTTDVQLTPWSGTGPVDVSDSFTITTGPNGGPCPSDVFSPTLNAGTTNPTAGRFSPLHLRLVRDDGEGELRGFSLTLPRGLVGKLAGIPACPDSTLASIPTMIGTGTGQIQSPSCPAASQVGTVTVGAGAGSGPFFVDTGRVYLAGPYSGSPLSLAVVAPAVAGPFDLGNVVIRTAVSIDPTTAEISAISDPLPLILEGIPLDLRDVRVAVDRSEFTMNPTSCRRMAFTGSATAASGLVAPLNDRFQASSCANLNFKPKLFLRLYGGTHRGSHPKLKAVVRARPGDANIAGAQVTLPHSEFLDQAHIKTVCTRVQFAAKECPTGSVYGWAVAKTPLFDSPLEGPVYLRSSSHNLPDLVAALKGPASQPVEVDLDGRIDSVNGGIRNTFELVPDAPVTSFTLTMQGGKKGLLVNSRNICERTYRAVATFNGHNGRSKDLHPALKNSHCR